MDWISKITKGLSIAGFIVAMGMLYTPTQPTIEEQGEHPGYEEQFYLMKQNEKGEIDQNKWRQWNAQTKALLGKIDFFSDVKELGPSNIGGRLRALVIDASNPNHYIAGGSTGGMWNSYNAGASWEPAFEEAPNLAVSGIAQNPFNPSEIYYCTGGRSKLSGGVSYNGDGLFKSEDGGKTYFFMDSSATEAFQNSWDMAYSQTDSNTFYIATLSNGLYRTRDKGLTYDLLYSAAGNDIFDVDALPNGRVYFSVNNTGIFYFDEADTPQVVKYNIPIAPGFWRCYVEVAPSDYDIIYACFAPNAVEGLKGIFKSTDAGATWKELTNPATTGLSFVQSWANLMLAVSPRDPNFILCGAVDCGFSTNGGVTWKKLRESMYQGQGHVDYHNMVFVPNSNQFLALNDGGVYRYTTSTADQIVTDLNTKLNITQIYSGAPFPNGDFCIIGNQDNYSIANLNTGSTFGSMVLGGDGSFNAIDKTGEYIYASSQNGRINRWSGSRWVSSIYNSLVSVVGNEDFWFINPFEINMEDGRQIYFPTRNFIARSTNQGNSWAKITNSISGSIYAVGLTPEEDPDLYFGGQAGILYRIDAAKTATPGNSFKMFTTGPALSRGGFISCIKVDPNEHSTIYIAKSNGGYLSHIWKIEEANTETPQWTDISGDLPTELPVNWIEVDPKNSDHIMVGTDYGLYVTANGGRFWHKEERIPNVYVSMVRLRESDRRLFVFTYGRGVWTAQLNEDVVASNNDIVKDVLTVYPNPTTDKITVQVADAIASVEVFSATGQQMGCAIENKQVDVSHLPKGNYFIRVHTGEETFTKKFVKL